MNTKFNTKNVLNKGFSLVEMLVVIAVIGIIAAIAIPSIGSINASAQTATAKRNAQNIASVYQSGLADGVAWGATDVATGCSKVQAGGTGTDGTYFGVKGLDSTAVTAASGHLSWDSSAGLIYAP
jgi:prepilin-type N-terminal cleavage/methylation domain-containing protein